MIHLPTNRTTTHPGIILNEEFVKIGAISVKQLASMFDETASNVNKILKGKRPITSRMATRLSLHFNMSESFWSTLQEDYDLTSS